MSDEFEVRIPPGSAVSCLFANTADRQRARGRVDVIGSEACIIGIGPLPGDGGGSIKPKHSAAVLDQGHFDLTLDPDHGLTIQGAKNSAAIVRFRVEAYPKQ